MIKYIKLFEQLGKVMRYFFIIGLWVGYVCIGLAQQMDSEPMQQINYVWANHVNLRESPSVEAKVITKLSYGTAVELLASPSNTIPYQMVYMNSRNAETEPVSLKGHWQKVRTADYEGYLFSELLLNIEPIKQGEYINNYLIRVFNLQPEIGSETHEKIEEGDGYTLVTSKQPYTSLDNKIVFTVITTYSKPEEMMWPGSGGEVKVVDMSFAQAMVFFNALIPPYMQDHFPSYVYQRDEHYEYIMDGPGNSASLVKTPTGLLFSWFDAGD